MKLKKRSTALLMAATMGFSTMSNTMIINAQMKEEGLCEICDSQFMDQGSNEQVQSDLEQINTLATINDVKYLDEDGNTQTANNVTEVESNDTNWSDGWYVVSGDVTIDSRIMVEGDVHLILKDGASLDVNGGIGLQENASFSVYAQSTGNDMGSLTATEAGINEAGIGGNSNKNGVTIIINGGNVAATGGEHAAGIGGGERGDNASVTINGGKVIATGGTNAAGIGGGERGDNASVTINGGDISAEGTYGAGIGGAYYGDAGNITIHGGNIIATGNYGAGIGGGSNGSGGSITIHGGNIIATGNYGAGIGGGDEGSGGTIIINDGDVTATNKRTGAGIGGGNKGSGGTIIINGGDVTAISKRTGAGIGGGNKGSGGTITIEGGNVNATSERSEVGIGDGSGGSEGTFATGKNGNALIVSNGVISDQSNKDKWSGIIFEGDAGAVYGDQTLQENLEIQSNQSLTIKKDSKLTVNQGVTLTCNGTIDGEGTLTGDGQLEGSGTVASSVDNHFQKQSKIVVSFDNNEHSYGSNVVITATISLDTSTFAAEPNEVEFFVGTESLGKAKVNNNIAKITIPLSGKMWKAGQHTITAEYGGSMGLKPETGTAILNVIKAQQTNKPTVSVSKTTKNSITLNANDSGERAVEYVCVLGEQSSVPVDVNWTSSNTFDNLTAGTAYTVFARYVENEYYESSPASEGVLVYTVPEAPEVRVITIDYNSETISFDENTLEVKTTQNEDGINIQNGGSIKDYIKDTEQKIYVRLKENGKIPASAYQEVTIPVRPSAPGNLQGVNETYMGAHNGKITGVSTDMQYQKDGESSWTNCTGTTIEKLAPATYRVRYASTQSSFASDSVEIVIATKQPAPGSGSGTGGSTVQVSSVYRAYNPNNGEHLYTLDEKEYKHVTSVGWHAEGVAFMAEEENNGQALFRVYNPNSGLHHYTLDENEKNTLVSLGWHDEKVAWYTSKNSKDAPVYRVYNPNDGNHHYTMDKHEKDVLVTLGWHDEGLAFRTAPIETK